MFKRRLNVYYIKSLISYTNKFSYQAKEIISGDDDKNSFIFLGKDLDYAVDFIKELNGSLSSLYQNKIGSISSLFD